LIPYLTKGDLTKLPTKRQKKVCGCSPPCTEFITIATEVEDIMLCHTDANEFAFEILELLGLVTEKRAFPKSKRGWTTEQERFVIKYLKEEHCYLDSGRMRDGTYSLIGEMLGKSREQIKDKVNHLRKAGRL
jgi:hypothetical protein